ncbi:MAG: cadherin-like domain-containing protein, partial [Salinibacter sp.]
MTRRTGIRNDLVAVASFLLSALLLAGCDLTGGQSTPQSPQFTVENDLDDRITFLGDQAQSSMKRASAKNFAFDPIIRVASPVVGGDTTVASYLSFNANGGDRVFVGYKIRGKDFGGGIDILNAENPDSLTSVNSVRSSNLDVQEVVNDPNAGAEYVAGALQTDLADASPAAIVRLSISFGGGTVDQTTNKRLSGNVAKSVVNAPSSDAQHDLYVATDGNSLYRYTTDLSDQVRQTTSSGVEFSSIAAHQNRVILLTKTGELWRSSVSSTSPPSTDSTVSLDGSGINPVGIARVRTGTHAATSDRFVFAALNQGGFRVLNADATTTRFSRTSGHYTSVSASGDGNYLFASRDNGRVEVYEFTGSTGSPSWTASPIATINTRDYGSVPPETQANQVLAVNNYLYVANSRGGVLVLSFGDNQAPTANEDSAQTTEDQSTTTDVLANDTDPDGSLDPATVQVQSSPSNGSVNVDGSTGEITYTPATDFTGSDSYTYTVGDGDGATSDPATVSVTVSAT